MTCVHEAWRDSSSAGAADSLAYRDYGAFAACPLAVAEEVAH